MDGEKQSRTFTVRADPTFMTTQVDQVAREAFLVDASETAAKLSTQVAAFQTKRAAANGAEQTRLNALAETLGMGAAAAGRGGRGGGGPAGALGGIVGNYSGSGVRQATFLPPTAQMRAQLAEAKRVLAELDREMAKK